MKKIIHMDKVYPHGWYTICGIGPKFNINNTLKWKKVTCKNCLKMRKKK